MTMNKCYFQKWEESERGWGIRPDGCSLHISPDSHREYLNEIYNIRQNEANVPYEYDRVVGDMYECFVSDTVYDLISNKKSIRLMEHETRNLINLEEIIFKS